MESADLLRIARQRAGLTQQELARRSGHNRATIARWETGARGLTLEMLGHLVAACDLELVIHVARRDLSLEELVGEQLALSPIERLDRLVPSDELMLTLSTLRWVADSPIPSIVVGAVGAILQGAPQRSGNGHVELVSSDPYAMEQELRASDFQALDDDDRWAPADPRLSWTRAGRGTLTLVVDPPGASGGYKDLRRAAEEIQIAPDLALTVAHPRDLLRLGDASPRESERARVPGLNALLTRRRKLEQK